jgi:4'-phosphopantetheinyl transferase
MDIDKVCQWQAQCVSAPLAALQPGQLHLYAMRCDADCDALGYASYLSADEIKRAEALVQASDRARFILGRGLLRDFVGRYLGVAPAMVIFKYSDTGKPYVDMAAHGGGIATPCLHFNVSHSGAWLLYGFCLDVECGVDIEYINHKNNYLSIAKRFFHCTEFDHLQAMDPVRRAAAFCKLWVLKEAYAKATGHDLFSSLGMSLGMPGKSDKKTNSSVCRHPYHAEYLGAFSGYEAAWCWSLARPADVYACVLVTD